MTSGTAARTASPTVAVVPAASPVVPATSPTVRKACAAPRLVVTHVPCLMTEQHLLLGCVTSLLAVWHAVPVAAPPAGLCRRLVEVAGMKMCSKMQLVKECHEVPCPAYEW